MRSFDCAAFADETRNDFTPISHARTMILEDFRKEVDSFGKAVYAIQNVQVAKMYILRLL